MTNLQELQEDGYKEFEKMLCCHPDSDFYVNESPEKVMSFIQSERKKAFKAGQQDMLERVRGVIPKKIYVNGLRKYNKGVPEINSYNEAVVETLKALDNLN